MKILEIAPYLYNENHKWLRINKSGLAISISTTVSELSNSNDVLVTLNRFSKKTKIDNYLIVRHSLFRVLCFCKPKYLTAFFEFSRKNKVPFKKKIHYFFYYLNQGFIEHVIKKEKPDVVHVHSICETSELTCHFCERSGVPFLLTLHGIISNPSIDCPLFLKEMEARLTRFIDGSQYGRISTVSSGTASYLKTNFGINNKTIFLTYNGIKKIPLENSKTIDDNSVFRIICCGNVSKNKNQFQLMKILDDLDSKINKPLEVFLFGEVIDDRIEMYTKRDYKNITIKLFGFVSHSELMEYYKKSNLNVLLSYSEGFGLSIVEGYLNGVPALFFSDIDAALDLFDSNSSIMLSDRKDDTLLDGILLSMKKKWKKELIIKKGETFLIENTILQYQNSFEETIKSKKN